MLTGNEPAYPRPIYDMGLISSVTAGITVRQAYKMAIISAIGYTGSNFIDLANDAGKLADALIEEDNRHEKEKNNG